MTAVVNSARPMPSDDVVFRDYRPEDKPTILDLLAKGRPASYRAEKAAVFDWQFFGNPAAAGRSPFLVGTLGDEIVAVNGFVPVRARFDGDVTDASWSLDTYVSGEHRGRGFGKALIARVSTRAPVMLGFGISDMSDPIFEKAGWKLDPAMATLFFHSREPGLKGIAKNLLSQSSRRLRARKPSAVAQVALSAAPSETELDGLWDRVSSQYPNAVERTGRYLAWRYRDAPVLRYRWVTARRDGELCGVLVTRHHPIESVVVDYAGPLDDPALLASLLEVGCNDLVAEGTRRIRCESNDQGILDELAGIGFVRHRTSGRFRVRVNEPSPSTRGNWFVMTGDSDNDLLVL